MDPIEVALMVQNAANTWSSGKADAASREWQERMWHEQNEYNLPVNQRKRLEEAGINPNLAFGSSASAMGTSVPGTPAVHVPQVNVGEAMMRKKQIDAQVRAENANTDRINEETDRLRLANTIVSSLLQDTIETQRGSLFIDRMLQGWIEDNGIVKWDTELHGLELRNDLMKAQKLYEEARTNHTQQSIKNLIQEYEHLKNKYKFEDYYYKDHQNPYETSTAMGFMRTFLGMLGNFIDVLPGSNELFPIYPDRDFVDRLKKRRNEYENDSLYYK